VSDTGDVAKAPDDLVVVVQLSGGDSTHMNQKVQIPSGETTGLAAFDLVEHGDYEVRATAPGLREAVAPIRYGPPWLALSAALAGGLLGAGFRLSQRTPKQRKRLVLRLLVGGSFGAIFLLLLQVFSVLEKLQELASFFAAFSEVPALNVFGALLLGMMGGLCFEQLVGPFLGKPK
jgi:hypothetical protein